METILRGRSAKRSLEPNDKPYWSNNPLVRMVDALEVRQLLHACTSRGNRTRGRTKPW